MNLLRNIISSTIYSLVASNSNKENSNPKKNIWDLAKERFQTDAPLWLANPRLHKALVWKLVKDLVWSHDFKIHPRIAQTSRTREVQAVVDLGRNIRPFRVQNRRNMYTYNLFKYSNCCSASDSNKDTYYFLINPDEDEKLSEMASMVSEGAFRSVFRVTHRYELGKSLGSQWCTSFDFAKVTISFPWWRSHPSLLRRKILLT